MAGSKSRKEGSPQPSKEVGSRVWWLRSGNVNINAYESVCCMEVTNPLRGVWEVGPRMATGRYYVAPSALLFLIGRATSTVSLDSCYCER